MGLFKRMLKKVKVTKEHLLYLSGVMVILVLSSTFIVGMTYGMARCVYEG